MVMESSLVSIGLRSITKPSDPANVMPPNHPKGDDHGHGHKVSVTYEDDPNFDGPPTATVKGA